MAEHEGEIAPLDVKMEPSPGPSVLHDFGCTHDPCRCRPQPAHEGDLTGRVSALTPVEMLRLDQWAEALTWTFEDGLYLVGSVLTRRDPRDVDVRCRIPDDDPLLDRDRGRVVNVAMSVWAQQSTGLNIDFQFQSISEFAMHREAGKPVNPLGTRWRTLRRAPLSDRFQSPQEGTQ
jgi:hypothetical protein